MMVEEKLYYITWTAEDDALLTSIMASKMERRTTLEKLFPEAAEKLNRTEKAVRGRWYNVLQRKEKHS